MATENDTNANIETAPLEPPFQVDGSEESMAFYSAASGRSLWRGVDYYKNDNVASWSAPSASIRKGTVLGSNQASYDVEIDLEHPKKSTCTCPFAEGRHVICKHMVALYFESVEGAYGKFEQEVERAQIAYEQEEERWKRETYLSIKKEVDGITAKEAREWLIDILYQQELDYRYRNDRYW